MDSLLAAQRLAAQVAGQICLIVERRRDLTATKIAEWEEQLKEASEILRRARSR